MFDDSLLDGLFAPRFDVDGSGGVTLKDAMLLAKAMADQSYRESPPWLYAYDLAPSGKLDAADIMKLIERLLTAAVPTPEQEPELEAGPEAVEETGEVSAALPKSGAEEQEFPVIEPAFGIAYGPFALEENYVPGQSASPFLLLAEAAPSKNFDHSKDVHTTDYFPDVTAEGAFLAECMAERVTADITLNIKLPYAFVDNNLIYNPSTQKYEPTETIFQDYANAILDEAFRHDPSRPSYGDYIHAHFHAANYRGAWGSYATQYYLVTFTFNIEYLSTAAEEREITSWINQNLDTEVLKGAATDYEKIWAICKFIGDRCDYSTAAQINTYGNYVHSAHAALIGKPADTKNYAVCQGYSALFHRLLLEAGIDAGWITGEATFAGGGPHAWNLAELDEMWYFCDPTWDGQNVEDTTDSFFLKCEEEFTYQGHQKDQEYSDLAFLMEHPVAGMDYSYVKDRTIFEADIAPPRIEKYGRRNRDGRRRRTGCRRVLRRICQGSEPCSGCNVSFRAAGARGNGGKEPIARRDCRGRRLYRRDKNGVLRGNIAGWDGILHQHYRGNRQRWKCVECSGKGLPGYGHCCNAECGGDGSAECGRGFAVHIPL